jgi:anti-sigma factor ChrR (cupin superfamily)
VNHHRRITTISVSILMLFAFALQAFAHGGFDHVIGTIEKIDHDTLTVKTAKSAVDVKLTDKTEITSNDQKFAQADLKPGMRVVIDVPEGSKTMTAHSVKVGVTTAAHEHAGADHK